MAFERVQGLTVLLSDVHQQALVGQALLFA